MTVINRPSLLSCPGSSPGNGFYFRARRIYVRGRFPLPYDWSAT